MYRTLQQAIGVGDEQWVTFCNVIALMTFVTFVMLAPSLFGWPIFWGTRWGVFLWFATCSLLPLHLLGAALLETKWVQAKLQSRCSASR
jgi:sterol desaturase/sphingolipid hydroxylase (fatty acid hydroxylase superfamily)